MLYTAFCQSASGAGTIWIDRVAAPDVEAAKQAAREKCASDWEYEDPADIHVLGIAEGDVKILDWEDIGD